MGEWRPIEEEGSIKLVEDRFYWVLPAYGESVDWIVARWSAGCFWADQREISPAQIVGPILPPPPKDPA
jgi:hypothetical protein